MPRPAIRPWLRRASDGHVERLDQASGTAIGVVDDLRLKPGATNLSPTDLLLVFTDGLDEAVNSDGEMFGGERAARWLAQASPANAPELIDDLVHTHQRFTGRWNSSTTSPCWFSAARSDPARGRAVCPEFSRVRLKKAGRVSVWRAAAEETAWDRAGRDMSRFGEGMDATWPGRARGGDA